MRHNPGSVTVWAVAGQTLPEYSSAGTFHLILRSNLNPSELEFQLLNTHEKESGIVFERTRTSELFSTSHDLFRNLLQRQVAMILNCSSDSLSPEVISVPGFNVNQTVRVEDNEVSLS